MVSVIILTKNEERDLPACLESLRWCDDIHILDSGSTDGTRDIAKAHGASVLSNEFQSFGIQRNWAIDRYGDDLSIYERMHVNMIARPGWIMLNNGYGRDVPDNTGGWHGSGYSEMPMRNQFATWRSSLQAA